MIFSAVKFFLFWSSKTLDPDPHLPKLLNADPKHYFSIPVFSIHLCHLTSLAISVTETGTDPDKTGTFGSVRKNKSEHLQFCHFLVRIRRKSFNLTCEELSSGDRKVNPAQGKKM
jgi:hypothetical protein